MACHSNVIFMCVGRPFSGLHHFHTIINLSFLPRCIYLLFVRPFLSLCRSLSLRTPKTWKSNFDFVLGATHIGAHILLSILFDTTDNCGDTTNQSDEPIQRYIPMHSTKVFETFDSANWIDNVCVCIWTPKSVFSDKRTHNIQVFSIFSPHSDWKSAQTTFYSNGFRRAENQ